MLLTARLAQRSKKKLFCSCCCCCWREKMSNKISKWSKTFSQTKFFPEQNFFPKKICSKSNKNCYKRNQTCSQIKIAQNWTKKVKTLLLLFCCFSRLCVVSWNLAWLCLSHCGLVWPFIVLYSLSLSCMVFVVLYGEISSYLAVIDSNSFDLVFQTYWSTLTLLQGKTDAVSICNFLS